MYVKEIYAQFNWSCMVLYTLKHQLVRKPCIMHHWDL